MFFLPKSSHQCFNYGYSRKWTYSSHRKSWNFRFTLKTKRTWGPELMRAAKFESNRRKKCAFKQLTQFLMVFCSDYLRVSDFIYGFFLGIWQFLVAQHFCVWMQTTVIRNMHDPWIYGRFVKIRRQSYCSWYFPVFSAEGRTNIT